MNSFYPNIPVKIVNPDASMPEYAHDGDAGMDLCSMESVTLAPGETKMVGTGISMAIPDGYVGLVFPRSGLGSRGLTLSNCVGVIDSGYRGEIKAPLHNNHPTMVWADLGSNDVSKNEGYIANHSDFINVYKGDRVCQIVFVPFGKATLIETDNLEDSPRGESGFGSTGISGGERL